MLVTKADGCWVAPPMGEKILYEGELDVKRIRVLIGADVIEVCDTLFPQVVMFIDEEGKPRGKELNLLATSVYKYTYHNKLLVDFIVGTVMFVPREVYDKLNEEIEAKMSEEDNDSP